MPCWEYSQPKILFFILASKNSFSLRESRFVFSPILKQYWAKSKNLLFFYVYFLYKQHIMKTSTSETDVAILEIQSRTSLIPIEHISHTTLQFKLVQDIENVEKIWKHFNPSPKNIYQDWEYIKIFHESYNYTPYFYTAYIENTPVACIPLEWIPEKNHLALFGNRSYGHHLFSEEQYEYVIPLLLRSITLPLYSESIICEKSDYIDALVPVDLNYILEIHDVSDWLDYLSKKYVQNKRSKLLKEMRNIAHLNIAIEDGKEEDLEWFFLTNQKIFWDDSAYHDVRRQDNIRRLYRCEKIPSFIRTFRIDGEIVAVRFLIKDPYSDSLYAVNGATEKSIANLGKFVILDYINLWLSLGCRSVDLGSTSFGYKQNWASMTHPVYDFKK